ncbi:tRNA lysidine(34) synthetase TilS [Sporosarcina oncorhynchi]|uniref:tRNA(Ile)-lysidine synthase n=1 Tax=Sporosarcina oncorhynchi TaxID=3056444 RepID=A0ABZ0L518_9BACL|nr:tRNA lysidine(34) synthetase TilS [Sporosarcina sp. T2O-4]WOV87646.1 tRNA lysidine(34) synthetase TilS [Sporosarcina sp. T2O-4]
MNELERKIMNFIDTNKLLNSGQRVLVACSGGVDSVALLLLVASLRTRLQIDVAAAHVDHMLRGEESAEDGTFVKNLCEELDIPFFSGQVPVPKLLAEQGGNVQDICRTGRYAYFSSVMRNEDYQILATAHHAEDQLETVLMQLSRGSQPVGIQVNREMEGGTVIRPLLAVMKNELKSYIREKDSEFREDPSNESDGYLRNRLRHQVAPILLAENAAAAVNIVKATIALQTDESLLNSLANERFQEIVSYTNEGFPSFSINMFSRMHTALQTRFITLVLKYIYSKESEPLEYSTALLSDLHQQLLSDRGNIMIDLPGGFRLHREYDRAAFVKTAGNEVNPKTMLPIGEWTKWGQSLLYWNTVDKDVEDASESWYFNLPDSDLPLFVRSRHDGDRILLPGMTQPKRLSRLFIDEKIGAEKRRELPVLITANDVICAVPGVRYGVLFKKRHTELDQYIFRTKEL